MKPGLLTGLRWQSSAVVAKCIPSAAQVVTDGKPLLSRWQLAYLLGLVPLELYCSFLHAPLWRGALPFAPLMATSAYCAAGVVGFWATECGRYAALAHSTGDLVDDGQRTARERKRR